LFSAEILIFNLIVSEVSATMKHDNFGMNVSEFSFVVVQADGSLLRICVRVSSSGGLLCEKGVRIAYIRMSVDINTVIGSLSNSLC
jgi:hypothetical protein